MRRVLIPSDNRDFVFELARGYSRLGWDVVTGRSNFELETGNFDLVHLQWPEEFCDWRPPSASRLQELGSRLDRWNSRSRLLLTVHNLFPHEGGDTGANIDLYTAFYSRVPVLAHFTVASQKLVTARFSAASSQHNIVTGLFNFDGLLRPQRDGPKARKRFGFAPGDFVILVFGALRSWKEVRMVREAFSAAQVRGKRLLMAGRYHENGPPWRQRWRRFAWRSWLLRNHAVRVEQFVPDGDVHGLVDAADVLLVARLDTLNSGLPLLAATFGKPWIAPDCGAFREVAEGTQNPVFAAGDAASLARALERVASKGSAAYALENRARADAWRWETLIQSGLRASFPK